jgi:hypothetical protein
VTATAGSVGIARGPQTATDNFVNRFQTRLSLVAAIATRSRQGSAPGAAEPARPLSTSSDVNQIENPPPDTRVRPAGSKTLARAAGCHPYFLLRAFAGILSRCCCYRRPASEGG